MNDPKRDTFMPKLIALKLVLFLGEIILLILGSVWIFSGNSSCDQTVNKTKALIVTGYVWISLCVVRILCHTDPAGCCRGHTRGRDDQEAGLYRASERSWERCCRFVCCLADLDNSNRGVILDISRLFSTILFKSGISGKMVATDIASAMALVQLRQKQEEKEHTKTNNVAAGDRPYSGKIGEYDHLCLPLDFNNPEQKDRIEECRNSNYYFKYALAAYGWPLLMCMHFGTGLCRLAPNCQCCTCCRMHTTPNDHCVECNTAAILCQTGLERNDLIHVTYHNKPYQPPYFVAVDRLKQSVVIAIRGTMSISDALTDLTADAVSFGDGNNPLHAHGGIYKAARYVKTQLEPEQGHPGEQSILQKAFKYANKVDPQREYKLVIIGHSLGGGTATILSLLYILENQDRFPGLACYAYSPPGGLLSLPAVELTKQFTTSIVVGKDMIPRLSLETIYQLCRDMKREADNSMSPKWLIQLKCLCACCCKCCQEYHNEMSNTNEADEEILNNSFGDRNQLTTNSNPTTLQVGANNTVLYLAGNVLYLVEVQTKQGKKSSQAFWTDYREFHTVIVGAAMVGDHFPHHVHDALHKLISQSDPKISETTPL